jgi:hypothetical protein
MKHLLVCSFYGMFVSAAVFLTGADLRVALDAALAGSGLPAEFKPRPSIGCNIK